MLRRKTRKGSRTSEQAGMPVSPLASEASGPSSLEAVAVSEGNSGLLSGPAEGRRKSSKERRKSEEKECDATKRQNDEKERERGGEDEPAENEEKGGKKKGGSRIKDLRDLMTYKKRTPKVGSGTLSARRSSTKGRSASDLREISATTPDSPPDGESGSPPASPYVPPKERSKPGTERDGPPSPLDCSSEQSGESTSSWDMSSGETVVGSIPDRKGSLGINMGPKGRKSDGPSKRGEYDEEDDAGDPIEFMESKRKRCSSLTTDPPIERDPVSLPAEIWPPSPVRSGFPPLPSASTPLPPLLAPSSPTSPDHPPLPSASTPLPPPLALGDGDSPAFLLPNSGWALPNSSISSSNITNLATAGDHLQMRIGSQPHQAGPPPVKPEGPARSPSLPTFSSFHPSPHPGASPPSFPSSKARSGAAPAQSAKPRPILPTLRLAASTTTTASGSPLSIPSLTSRVCSEPSPSMSSPRFLRSSSFDRVSADEHRRLQERIDGLKRHLGEPSDATKTEQPEGDLFDQMIYSRWEEYDNMRRLRSGNRRYIQSRRGGLAPSETAAIKDKLQTDANVFLGAIKEMVKQRTAQRMPAAQEAGSSENPQAYPRRSEIKSRRRKETEMRINRERKGWVRRSVVRESIDGLGIADLQSLTDSGLLGSSPTERPPRSYRYSMSALMLSSSDGLDMPMDSPTSCSDLDPLSPSAPPPPPPAPASDMQDEGKWGYNMLSSEHPVIYEELFTLAASEIENVPGIYRWRIEHLVPVWISHLDEDHPINHFYESDCYLVLYVGRAEDDDDPALDQSPVKKDDGALAYNLHYWIGRTSSVDKKTSVCFRAVQLNSYIGGKAKHYPEQQGEESSTFLSYYRKANSRKSSLVGSGSISTGGQGHPSSPSSVTTSTTVSEPTLDIVYVEGGTESGLRKVKGVEQYEIARLYRFFMLDDDGDEDDESASTDDPWAFYDEDAAAARKRKRNGGHHYYIQLVEPVTRSLNEKDVFLLDTGGYLLFQWNGKDSRQRLKLVCNEILLMMNVIERKSVAQVEVLSQEEEVLSGRKSLFWQFLRDHKPPSRAASEAALAGAATDTASVGEGDTARGPGREEDLANEQNDEEKLSRAKRDQRKTLFLELISSEGGTTRQADGDGQLEHRLATTTVPDPASPTDPDVDGQTVLGGIMEILEVRGDYGSMDLHTTWVQKKPADLRSPSANHLKEGIRPSRNVLSSQGVFIIDCTSEIFVYSGRNSTAYSRQIAAFIANQMKEDAKTDPQSKRPACTITLEVREREEPILFKARFLDWLDDESGKWGAKEKQAPKDYRPFHERLLDEIRKKARKNVASSPQTRANRQQQGMLKRPELPEIDVTTLFPPTDTAASSAVAREGEGPEEPGSPGSSPTSVLSASNSGSGTDDKTTTKARSPSLRYDGELESSVEVGILLSGKAFHKLPEAEVGHFYSGECYVILHSFHDKVKDVRKWIIYFWEGKNGSSLKWPTFLLGLYPILEDKISSSGGGIPEKRRIYQGEETAEFMGLFKDSSIVIRRGPRPPTSEPVMEMFEAKCRPRERMTRLVSVECNERSLHTQGAYGLFLPSGKVYIWRGRQSSQRSTDALKWLIAATTADLPSAQKEANESPHCDAPDAEQRPENAVAPEKSESDDANANSNRDGAYYKWHKGVQVCFVGEGAEPTEFWAALGSSRRSDDGNQSQSARASARLARFYYEAGKFRYMEVTSFSQRDLLESCIYLLQPIAPRAEAGTTTGANAAAASPVYDGTLFLWIGRQTTDMLRIAARHTAKRYAQHIALHAALQLQKERQTAAVDDRTAASGDQPTADITDGATGPMNNGAGGGGDDEAAEAAAVALEAGDECNITVEDVDEGRESAEFTRFFPDWTRTVFVDPYELRMLQRQAGGGATEATCYWVANDGDGGQAGPAADQAANGTAADSADQANPEEARLADQARKNKEREEFLRKLREDRLRQGERRLLREKKEEDERRRRREKQEMLRAKLKMLEHQVFLYNLDVCEEENDYQADDDDRTDWWDRLAQTSRSHRDYQTAIELQRGCDTERATGETTKDGRTRVGRAESLPALVRPRKDLALERLKERQEELLGRLRTRSRSRVSSECADNDSPNSSSITSDSDSATAVPYKIE